MRGVKTGRGLSFLAGVMILFLMHGCASKHAEEQVSLIIPERSYGQEELNSVEKAAFETEGQIDSRLSHAAKSDIAPVYAWYLRQGRRTIEISSQRAQQYIAHAREVFRKRGMPEELANLAIIESGYRPDAVSHAGAAGAWQFMPATGERYGLAQDWWTDERLDPYRSAEAAADYLQKLYNQFGDWPTAIAAYNAGEGKMSRARAGTGATDFFELKARNHVLGEKEQLRTETQQYVPKFLAVSKIMRNLPKLGFQEIKPENAESVMRCTAAPGTDLKELCQNSGLDWAEFVSRNPHHKRSITCTDKPTNIYVPASAAAKVAAYLCTDKKTSYAGWRPTPVAKSGDTLEKISKRANVPLARLMAANPGLGKLKSGQIILVPGNADLKVAEAAPKASKSAKNKSRAQAAKPYTIQPSDTLYSIARKFNVSVAELKTLNGMADGNYLKAGQNLAIPGAGSAAALKSSPAKAQLQKSAPPKQAALKNSAYQVKANDSLWNIARRHNVTVEDLKRWNRVDEKSLRPGSMLVVSGS